MISEAEILYYHDIAQRTAERSKARRLQVGAVLVSTDRIMGIGYNGTPEGWDNNCEDELADGSLVTKPEVIHAEQNALFKFLANGVSAKGATMFLTLAPCVECAKSLYLAQIAGVYYAEEYRSTAGPDFLRKGGIPVTKLNLVEKNDYAGYHTGMAISAKAQERQSRCIPRSVQNASWDEIAASRPTDLIDRVRVFAAIAANLGLDESADVLHCLAFLEEFFSPVAPAQPLTFKPRCGVYSPEVEQTINNLVRLGDFQGCDKRRQEADWVEPLRMTTAVFDDAYEARWTPWGFALWCHVEGLMDSGHIGNNDQRPRVHVNNTARDLTWVIESLSGWSEWDGIAVSKAFAIQPIYDALIAAGNEKQLRPRELVWYLARYLCLVTDQRLPASADFGGRRYVRVLKEISAVEGTDPTGLLNRITFFEGDEIVGRLDYREENTTSTGAGHTWVTGDHHLVRFEIEPAFRGRGIGQVMIRHAMSRDVRHVPADLAKTLQPLMVRHGVLEPTGAVRLARVHWGKAKQK
jgi:dCMP deaminase